MVCIVRLSDVLFFFFAGVTLSVYVFNGWTVSHTDF